MAEKRKNRKTILITLLLLLVVVTSALIGTLGKYMTSSTVSDDAVAAEFGLNIPNTINLFSDSYTNVQADESGKKIIAPGTSGKYEFNVTGTSEVAYTVGAEISVVYSEEWDEYAPLEFSIDDEVWIGLEQLKSELSEALKSEIMAPNTEYISKQTIHWRWPFHTSSENDAKDTELGEISADSETSPKVTVKIMVNATQVG